MSCYSELDYEGGVCPVVDPPKYGSYWGGVGNRIGRMCEVIQGPGAGRLVAGTEHEVPNIVDGGITYYCAGVACSMYHNGAYRFASGRPSYVWFWLHFVPEGDTYPTNARGGFLVAKVAEKPDQTGEGIPDFVFEPKKPWLTNDVWDHADKLVVDRQGVRTCAGADEIVWLDTTSSKKIKAKSYSNNAKDPTFYEWDNPGVVRGQTRCAQVSRHSYPLCLGIKTTQNDDAMFGRSFTYEAVIGDVRLSNGGLDLPPTWTDGVLGFPPSNIQLNSPVDNDDDTEHYPSNVSLFHVLDWDVSCEIVYQFNNQGEIADKWFDYAESIIWNSGLDAPTVGTDDDDAEKKLRWGQVSQNGTAVDTQSVLFSLQSTAGGSGSNKRGRGSSSFAEFSPLRCVGVIHPMGGDNSTFEGNGRTRLYDIAAKDPSFTIESSPNQLFDFGISRSLAPVARWESLGAARSGVSDKSPSPPTSTYLVGPSAEQTFSDGITGDPNDPGNTSAPPSAMEGFCLMVGTGGACPVFWNPSLKNTDDFQMISFGTEIEHNATSWQGLSWWKKTTVRGETTDKIIAPKDQTTLRSEGFIAFFDRVNGSTKSDVDVNDSGDPMLYNAIFPLYDKSDGYLRPGKPPRGFYIDAAGEEREGALAVQGQMDKVHPTKAWIKAGFTPGIE